MSDFNTNGWVDDQEKVEEIRSTLDKPYFSQVSGSIYGTGEGQVVLLHDIHQKAFGVPLLVRNQGSYGTCVAFGYATAVDCLKAADVYMKKDREEFVAWTATEDIYGGSRVNIGGGRISGDGSLGVWAAKYVTQYGTLLRKKYDGIVDLTNYSGSLSRQWGKRGNGVPKDLIPIAKEHPVEKYNQVRTYEEARDAIANGYPVPVCSNQGFSNKRDSEGFSRPSGSWAHCMVFIGVDDNYKRKGLLCLNSWGTRWNGGPKRHNQPDGSFWVDANTAESMLRRNDSWSMCGFDGYKKRELSARWI